jgi:hypothetical protein
VYRRRGDGGDLEPVCRYERNHALYQTFEPFRQGDRALALVSRDYTATAVLDLASGRILAEEKPSSWGFCPVGFYVPDWWDLNDGSLIPGSARWTEDDEWPTGDFGFVWGCIWADDSSWKVQLLDLSRVQEGVIRREERFGYLELHTNGHRSPCFERAAPRRPTRPHFIDVSRHGCAVSVTFAVDMTLDLASGEPREWQRRPSD